MKPFLAVSSVLAFLFGAALLFAAPALYAPMRIGVTRPIAVPAQAQGRFSSV